MSGVRLLSFSWVSLFGRRVGVSEFTGVRVRTVRPLLFSRRSESLGTLPLKVLLVLRLETSSDLSLPDPVSDSPLKPFWFSRKSREVL